MTKKILEIGMNATEMTVQGEIVSGKLEKVLERTVIVRDDEAQAHLISKELLKKHGYTLPKTNKSNFPFQLPTPS
ncbi:hypothetical protein [Candidatus Enterococcus ikei]|uniref:Uncharacterized protein n=1 Tax=Candidatus Enterococcus ikei TaxID=2815326 RepID=A0ABS3H1X4_9ENTE|nr:hypothetical protein [Enterococcus sp. DIV0869a]MBO0441521.1 hypothetical protein [Enterococcus sp. DIV0869a]